MSGRSDGARDECLPLHMPAQKARLKILEGGGAGAVQERRGVDVSKRFTAAKNKNLLR